MKADGPSRSVHLSVRNQRQERGVIIGFGEQIRTSPKSACSIESSRDSRASSGHVPSIMTSVTSGSLSFISSFRGAWQRGGGRDGLRPQRCQGRLCASLHRHACSSQHAPPLSSLGLDVLLLKRSTSSPWLFLSYVLGADFLWQLLAFACGVPLGDFLFAAEGFRSRWCVGPPFLRQR